MVIDPLTNVLKSSLTTLDIVAASICIFFVCGTLYNSIPEKTLPPLSLLYKFTLIEPGRDLLVLKFSVGSAGVPVKSS